MNALLASPVANFLCPKGSPYTLALLRAIFFGWLAIWYFNFDFSAISYHPQLLWWPVDILQVFGLTKIPDATTLDLLQTIWKISLILSCLGFLTRLSTGTACLLGTYLLGLTHSFHKINHSDAGLVFTMGILCLSGCGHVFSIDRILTKKIRKKTISPPPVSEEYGWPVQMVRLLFCLIFFAAGLSKLLAGPEWTFSDNVYRILSICQLTREPILDLTGILPHLRIPVLLTAVYSVFIELTAPLALFSKRARIILIPSLLFMQIGIKLGMGDTFTQFMAIYLFWIPWAELPLIRVLNKDSFGGYSAAELKTR